VKRCQNKKVPCIYVSRRLQKPHHKSTTSRSFYRSCGKCRRFQKPRHGSDYLVKRLTIMPLRIRIKIVNDHASIYLKIWSTWGKPLETWTKTHFSRGTAEGRRTPALPLEVSPRRYSQPRARGQYQAGAGVVEAAKGVVLDEERAVEVGVFGQRR